jgi:hypothetical protein
VRNKDRRFERYQQDPTFHTAVCAMENLMTAHNFTHQDLQDAAFVAAMKFFEANPVPLSFIQHPNLEKTK